MSRPAPAAPDTPAQKAAPRGRGGALLNSGWAALVFFLLASAAFTWPLVTHLSSSLPDWGDAADSARNIGSIAHQLRTDPFRLYDNQGLYPYNNDLTYGEIMTAIGLLAAPVIWLTDNVPLAFNILNFSSYVLSGLAMWLLVKRLTGSGAAGIVSGMIFAFAPSHYGQYYHLGLAQQQWMVFALFFLVLFLAGDGGSLLSRRSLAYLALFALFVVLQALSAGYYAYYEAIVIALYALYHVVFASGAARWAWRRLSARAGEAPPVWKRLAGQAALLAVAGALSAAAIYPFVAPYAKTKAHYGFSRPIEEVNYFSAGPNSLLRANSRSLPYAPLQGLAGGLAGEGDLYPGATTLALAVVGLAGSGLRRGRERKGRAPWIFLVISLAGLVLSFGPSFNTQLTSRPLTSLHLPYKWLYEYVPGWDSMRVPARFSLVFMLGLAVCAGFGVAYLVRRSRESGGAWARLGPPGIAALCALLVSLEFFAPGLPAKYTGAGPDTPAIYRWLASVEGRQVVPPDALLLELPISEYPHPITSNPIYLVYGLEHGHPMLNASLNILPPGFERFFADMKTFPDLRAVDVMQGLGARYLIVHTGSLDSDDRRARLYALAGPGGRLEAVHSFPDLQGDPRFSDVIYRVKPDLSHVAKIVAAIPEGATVMLAESEDHLSMYTEALAGLLGPGRRYFSQYPTMYNALLNNVQQAEPNKFYDYAILYKQSVALHGGSAGYAPSEAVPGAENDIVQIYRK